MISVAHRLALPPGEKWRQYELRALGLRDFAGAREDGPLDPFALARFANLLVADFDQIAGLSVETRARLLGAAANEWSGGACARALPDGSKVIILNPQHGRPRRNATLMEEICHVFLGHTPNRLVPVSAGTSQQPLARDYNQTDETAAYGIGAAALLPYGSLRKFTLQGKSAGEIARHFHVSQPLVEYRLKVTRLWSLYKSARDRTQSPAPEPRLGQTGQ